MENSRLKFFKACFPGAEGLLHGTTRRGKRLHLFVRTDGVSACVVFRRSPTDKKSPTTFPVPIKGQRLVAIDPGRRDMIYAIANDYNVPSVEERIKMSTKQWCRQSGRDAAKKHTTKSLKRVMVAEDLNLFKALQNLPSHRDFWGASGAHELLGSLFRCFYPTAWHIL
jgi:hypothetical protein